jgi:lipopolysaccharide export system protein LptC
MRARARRLRALGLVLALLGVGLAAAFLIQAGLLEALLPKAPETPVAVPLPSQVTGQQAHYSGLDKSGQPYDINAKTGIQDKTVETLIHLEEVTGTFHRQGDGVVAINAPAGRYDTKARQMELTGGVKINDGDRFTAVMDRAKVGVEDRTIVSETPVSVTMPQGDITANRMEVAPDGQRILFQGAVKARFGTTAATKGDNTP